MSQSLVIPQHVAEKLAKEACSNCKFSFKEQDRDIVCRRMPPTAWLVAEPMPPPHVNHMGFRIRSGHPVVESAMEPGTASKKWCGEWKPKNVN